MKNIILILIVLILFSCNTSSKVVIPVGRYINPDGTIWSSGGTDPIKDLDIYSYSPKKKAYTPIIQFPKK